MKNISKAVLWGIKKDPKIKILSLGIYHNKEKEFKATLGEKLKSLLTNNFLKGILGRKCQNRFLGKRNSRREKVCITFCLSVVWTGPKVVENNSYLRK